MGKLSSMNKGSGASDNPHRKASKSGQRDKATIQRLNMYTGGKPIRNKEGKVIGGKLMMDNTAGGQKITGMARIAPDRRWFGNTRTMSQTELDRFRDEMTTKQADPYSVILRRKKIPMALLQDSAKVAKINLLETETYDNVFGNKQTRKKPKLTETLSDYAALAIHAEEQSKKYSVDKDSNIEVEVGRGGDARKDDMFSKGQSKRIWSELYKVLDCSDVVLQIVDARNVPGTRCFHVENHIRKNASHKHLVS